MESALIGALAAAIGAPVAFALLRRFFPVPRSAEVNRSLGDLRREYRRWELLTLPLLFAIAPVATYLWWRIFLSFAPLSGFSSEASVVALRPSATAWLLPALLLGILSAGPPIDAILRRLLKGRHHEYIAYQNLQHGFDSEAIEKPAYLGFGTLAAIGVFLIGNCYAIFTPTDIRLNPFFGIREHAFHYSDVATIRTAPAFVAPNGRTVHRRQYVVEFSDSSSWSTRFDSSDATEDQIRSLIRAVSARSGVPISEEPLLDHTDFW